MRKMSGWKGKEWWKFFDIYQKTHDRGFAQYLQKLGVEPCQKVLLLLLTDIDA